MPALLEGLKVAFGTSILGLAGALTFRIIRPFITPENIIEEEDDDKKLMELLNRSAIASEENQKILTQGFEDLKNIISDENDKTLSSKLNEIKDTFEELDKTTKYGFETQIKGI